MTFRPSSHRPGTTYECGNCDAPMCCRCPVTDLTTAEAAKLAGVAPRTAQAWRRDGLIEPSIPVPPIAVEYHFGFIDLMAMRFTKELRARRCPTWLLKSSLDEFRRSEIDFRALAGREMAIWALAPVDEELGQMTRNQFGRTLLLLPDQEAKELGTDEQWLSFDCLTHAQSIDESLEQWHAARDVERPTWA